MVKKSDDRGDFIKLIELANGRIIDMKDKEYILSFIDFEDFKESKIISLMKINKLDNIDHFINNLNEVIKYLKPYQKKDDKMKNFIKKMKEVYRNEI